MPDKFAYVEFSAATGKPIRIFRTEHAASVSPAWDLGLVKLWNRARAVDSIRRQVFERDGWACVHCSESICWKTGHMHERQARGQILQISENEWQGGEISLDNSVTLCAQCHLYDKIAGHGDRQPDFSKDPIIQ